MGKPTVWDRIQAHIDGLKELIEPLREHPGDEGQKAQTVRALEAFASDVFDLEE